MNNKIIIVKTKLIKYKPRHYRYNYCYAAHKSSS